MATITVDGQQVEAPDGAPLVEVLKHNGFYVSSLCYIDGLKPYAGCRTCLVDIEGQPGLQLSCTAIVQDGMSVTTNSDEVRAARRSVTAIILANHSDRCLTCHRREHCHPGDICLRDDIVTHRCLTCAKNYRCELQATCEVVHMAGYEPYIGEERSWYQTEQPPADRENPFFEFDPQMCIICTRCVRACDEIRHTGAITLGGRGYESRITFGAGGPIHESNCDFCGACIDVCPVAALMEHPNKWVAKPERWTSTTCESCAIGCSIQLGQKDGRGVIVRPGDANPVSGNQLCVRGRFNYDSLKPRDRLQRHQVRRGPILAPASLDDAVSAAASALKSASGKVGVLVGGNLTNEEGLAAREISRSLGASIDQSYGPAIRATTQALEARFGTWRMATDMTRIATSKAIVVVHDDIEESHNIASLRSKDAHRNGGAALIVIGALRSELADFADVWIETEWGAEGAAAAHLGDVVAGTAQPASENERRAAALLAEAPRDESLVLCAPNPVSAPIAGAMAGGAANLAIALFGEAASENLVVLPPEANTNGLLDLGIGAESGIAPDLSGISALLVVRDDPTMRLPVSEADIARLDTVVVIDNVLHPTAKAASVVIAEGRAYAGEGTYTNADYRVQRLSPAIRPEGQAVRCYDALAALGSALGVEIPATPDDALGVISRERPEYQAAWDLLIGDGIRLDIPRAGSARTAPVETPQAASGVRVITSRDLYTADDAAALRHDEAEKLHRYDHIQVSEEDAARWGIADGDPVSFTGNGVTLEAAAWVIDRVPEGSIYVSSLFQGGIVTKLFTGSGLPAVEVRTAVPA